MIKVFSDFIYRLEVWMTVQSVQPCFYIFLLQQVGKCNSEITQLGYLQRKLNENSNFQMDIIHKLLRKANPIKLDPFVNKCVDHLIFEVF